MYKYHYTSYTSTALDILIARHDLLPADSYAMKMLHFERHGAEIKAIEREIRDEERLQQSALQRIYTEGRRYA